MADVSISLALTGVDAALSGLRKIEDSFKGLGDRVRAAGQRMQDMGQSLTLGVSAPLVGFATAGLKAAGDFERALNIMQPAIRATASEMEDLQKLARDLGPAMGMTATEVIKGFDALGRAGVKTDEILGGVGKAAIALATGAQGSMTAAAGAISDAMRIFDIQAEHIDEAVDVIVGALNESKFGFDDFQDGMAQSAKAAATIGMSFGEFATTLATTSAAFKSGSDAGTSLKTALIMLAKPTDEAKELMRKLGLEIFDAQGNMLPMREVAGNLQKAFAGLSNEQRTAHAATIAGSDGYRTLTELAKAGTKGFDEYAESIRKASAAQSVAANISGFVGALKVLWAQVHELAIAFGAETGLLKFATDVVKFFTDGVVALQRLTPEMKAFVVQVGGFAIAAGPLLVVLGGIVKLFAPLITGFGAMASPLGLAALGAVALVSAFDGWEAIGEITARIGRAIMDLGKSAVASIGDLRGFASEVRDAFQAGGIEAALAVVVAGFASLGGRIQTALSGIGSRIASFFADDIGSAGNLFSRVAETIGTFIAEGIPKGLAAIGDFGTWLSTSIRNLVTEARPKLEEIGGTIWDNLTGGLVGALLSRGVGGLSVSLASWLGAEIKQAQPAINKAAEAVGEFIAASIPDGFKSADTFVPTLLAALGSAFGAAKASIMAVAEPVGAWIAEAVTNALAKLGDMGSGLAAWVASWKIDPGSMAAMGARIGAMISQAAVDGLATAKSLGSSLAAWVTSGAASPEMAGAMANIGLAFTGAVEFVRNALMPLAASLGNVMSDWVSAGATQFNSTAGGFGQSIGNAIAATIAGAWDSAGTDSRVTSAVTKTITGIIAFAAGVVTPVMGVLLPRLIDGFASIMESFRKTGAQQLGDTMSSVGSTGGGKLITGIVDGIRGGIQVVGDLFASVTGVGRDFSAILAGAAVGLTAFILATKGLTAVGGYLSTVGTGLTALGNAALFTLSKLGTLLAFFGGPWGIALLAAGAAVAGIIKAFDLWPTISKYIDGAWASIKQFTTDVANAFRADTFGAMLDGVVAAFAGLGGRAVEGLKTFGPEILAKIQEKMAEVLPQVTISGEGLGQAIGKGLIAGIKLLSGLVAALTEWVSSAVTSGEMQSGVRAAMHVLADLFFVVVEFVVAVLKGFGQAIIDEIKAQLAPAKAQIDKFIDDYLVEPFKGMIKKIEDAWAGLKATIDRLIDDYIVAPLKALEGKIRNALPGSLAAMILPPEQIKAIEDNGKRIEPALVAPIEQAGVRITAASKKINTELAAELDKIPLAFAVSTDGAIAEAERLDAALVSRSIYPEMMDAIVGVVGTGMEEVTQLFGGAGTDIIAGTEKTGTAVNNVWNRTATEVTRTVTSAGGKIKDAFAGIATDIQAIVNAPGMGFEKQIEALDRLREAAEAGGKKAVAAIDDIDRALSTIYDRQAQSQIKDILAEQNAGWLDQAEAIAATTRAYEEHGTQGAAAIKRIADEVDNLLDKNLKDYGTEVAGAWADQIANIDRATAAVRQLKDAGKESADQLVELRQRVISAWANTEIEKVMDSVTMTIDEQKAAIAALGEFYTKFGVDGAAAMRAVQEAQENLARQTPTVLEGMKQGWAQYYNEVNNFGKTAADAVSDGMRTMQSTFSEFFKTGKFQFDDLKTFAQQTMADIQAQTVMSFVSKGVESFKQWALGGEQAATQVQTAVQTAATNATTATQAAATAGTAAVGAAATEQQGIMSGLWTFISTGWTNLVTGIQSTFSGLGTFFSDITTSIGGFFSDLWTAITTGASSLVTSLSEIFAGLATFFSELLGTIATMFGELWTALLEGASAAMSGLGEILGSIGTTIGGMLESVGTGFGGMWDTVVGLGSAAMDAIGIDLGGLGETFSGWFPSISEGFGTLFGGVTEESGTTFAGLEEGIAGVGESWGLGMENMTLASGDMLGGYLEDSIFTFGGVGEAATIMGGNFGETMVGMGGVATDTLGDIGTFADGTFKGIDGLVIGTEGQFGTSMTNMAGNAQTGWNAIGTWAKGNLDLISGGIAVTQMAANAFFGDLGRQANGAMQAVGGVATALAGLASGNPLAMLGGTMAAVQGAMSFFTSAHDNYSVDIGKDWTISTGTNTDPNPQNVQTGNAVAKQVADFLKSKGISEQAEVRVDDRGTVIKLQTGNDEFSRTNNDPNVALAEFKSHINENPGHWAGKAEGGLVLGGIPFSAPGSRDNVLLPLQTGEFVMKREATRQFHPLLAAINQGRVDAEDLGSLTRAGLGVQNSRLPENVVPEFFAGLEEAWRGLTRNAGETFDTMNEQVGDWREDVRIPFEEFRVTTTEALTSLGPAAQETFDTMGETLGLWTEDSTLKLGDFTLAATEQLATLAPAQALLLEEMGVGLTEWIDEGLLGWEAYNLGVQENNLLLSENAAATLEQMALGLTEWIDTGLTGWTTYGDEVGLVQEEIQTVFTSSTDAMAVQWETVMTAMETQQGAMATSTNESFVALGSNATRTIAAIAAAYTAMTTAVMAQLARIRAEATATVTAANAQIAGVEAGIARARAEAASLAAASYSKDGGTYDKDRGFATGGDAVFTAPTRIMVAEQGPEMISARPLGGSPRSAVDRASRGDQFVFNGPVIASDLSMGQLARRMMREIGREQRRLR